MLLSITVNRRISNENGGGGGYGGGRQQWNGVGNHAGKIFCLYCNQPRHIQRNTVQCYVLCVTCCWLMETNESAIEREGHRERGAVEVAGFMKLP